MRISVTYILMLLLLLVSGSVAYAAGSTSDPDNFPIKNGSSYQITWNGGDVKKSTTVVLPSITHTSNNSTIKDISIQLKKQITVKSGCTLTIKMDSASEWTRRGIIVVADGFTGNCMFLVEEGATLILEGLNNSNKYLGIKGSRNSGNLPTIYSNGTWTPPAESVYSQYYNTFKSGYGMVTTIGNVTMKNVHMYDSYCKGRGAALVVQRNEDKQNLKKYGKVTLTDCKIQHCVAEWGPALIIFNQVKLQETGEDAKVDNTYHPDYDPDNSAVTLENCTISNCYSTASGGVVCGTIRTGGGAYSNLKLINTTISGNYANGICAGIVWNAHGLTQKQTVCTFNGCTIENNKSIGHGAALYLSSSFEFVTNDSYIRGNVTNGKAGGVYIKAYSGVKGMEGYPQTMDMKLSSHAKITGNKAVDGAGVYIEDPQANDLGAGSTINVKIEGATISGNQASGNGGGVYFYGNNKTINFNFYLNSGTIAGNSAVNGAGFYGTCETDASKYVLDKERVRLYFNGGVIGGDKDADANTATTDGGGIYVHGLKIDCETTDTGVSVKKNNANGGDGGGLYISGDAEFSMNSGQVMDNFAGVYGGGLYVEDSEVSINGGDFYLNKSNDNGGGVFLESGTLTMSKIDDKLPRIRNNECGLSKSANAGGVYVKNGTFTINNGEITNNISSNYAGGLFAGQDVSEININNGLIDNNTAKYGGAVFIHRGNCYISGGTISGNTAQVDGGAFFTRRNLEISGNAKVIGNKALGTESKDEGETTVDGGDGGAICMGDGATLHMYGSSVISDNTAARYGGAIYTRENAVSVTIEDGTISGNSAINGGAICQEGGITTIDGGIISANTSTNYGGAIYAKVGNITITNGKITGNESKNIGGAINYNVSGGLLTISGGEISSNKAIGSTSSQGFGGGIHIANGNLTIEGENPLIKGNEATTSGGGISFHSTGTMNINGGKITDNIANVYGGGIYIKQGTLNLTGGEISGNSALATPDVDSGKGAGLYAADSKAIVNIDGGLFYDNKADYHGGAIYASVAPVTITGGEIKDNEARLGAGVFIYASKVVMSGGNIIDNKANRGGGVYLATSNADMTFGNGLITGNRASWTSSNLTTGYQQTGGQGFGGGVCVVAGTFAFDGASGVGLYNNIADKAGDDVFASGNGTKVTLPDVGAMNLSGYKTKTPELYWVEDYMTGDTGYEYGTYVNKTSCYKPLRYRDAVANQNLVYIVPVLESTTFTNYLALSIGHEIIYATLVRSCLLKGENAIYRVSRLDDNGTADKSDDRWTVYSELLLFGPEDALTAEQAANKSVSKRIALYSGTWKVEETNWAWTYDKEDPIIISREITGSSSPADKEFVFNGTKLKETDEGYVPAERYGESVVRNDFGNGTSD